MVWKYTEYAGCPTITDWIEKKFKFEITLDVDTIDITENSIETSEGIINTLKFETNNKLRPRYYMRIGDNKNSFLNLYLDRLKGLRRNIWTDKGVVEIGGLEYQSLKPQLIDTGNFDDFKKIGKYAVRRFPEISKEVILPPENFPKDIPNEEYDEIRRFTEACESFPWELTQKDLSKEFYDTFVLFTHYEINEGELQQKKKSFSDEEKKVLLEIVKPLSA